MSTQTLQHIHSIRAICEARGISEATVWRERQRGMLDEPIQISAGRVGWTDEQLAARREPTWSSSLKSPCRT